MELMDFGAVATGALANLGRDSTMAGTGIRTLTSKMIGLETTAKAMLDKELIDKAVRVDEKTFKKNKDGIQLTSDMLSQLAMEDLPRAINLLSQLHSEGDISLRTINKMFTTRQGQAISSLLQTIGGDWEDYSERIKTASSLTEDYEKQLSNLNNELGMLTSKFKASFSEVGQDIKRSFGTGLKIADALFGTMVDISGVMKIISSFSEESNSPSPSSSVSHKIPVLKEDVFVEFVMGTSFMYLPKRRKFSICFGFPPER